MRSGTKLCQFLRIFLPTFTCKSSDIIYKQTVMKKSIIEYFSDGHLALRMQMVADSKPSCLETSQQVHDVESTSN